MKRTFCLCGSMMIAMSVLAADYGAWKSTQIGGGGYLLNTVFGLSEPEVVYCNSDVGGIFKSRDGGKSWRMIHGNTVSPLYFVRSIDVDPRNSDVVLAAVGEQWGPRRGIYRTADGGDSWQMVCRSAHYGNSSYKQAGGVFARDPVNPDLVYMASSDGFFVSEDNGISWKNRGHSGHGISALVGDRKRSGRLWLCAQPLTVHDRDTGKKRQLAGDFFLTEDGGKSWARLADTAPAEMIQAPWDSNLLCGLFRNSYPAFSRDGGRSWTKLTDGIESLSMEKKASSSDASYAALGVGPDFWLLVSGKGSFYRLDRDSPRWRKIPCRWEQGNWFLADGPGKWQHFGRAASSITVDPANPDRWLFTDWYAVYRTEDAGKNWTLSIDGIEMTVIHHLVTDPAVSERVYLGMADNTILISKDSGATFVVSKNGKGNTKCIAPARNRPGRIYSVGPRNWEWKANALYVSEDSGQSWKLLPCKGLNGLDQNQICSLAVSPVDADELYVGRGGKIAEEEGGVWRSTDGGRNFTWFGQGMEQGKNFFRNTIWHSGVELAISGDGKSLVAVSQSDPVVYYREPSDDVWRKSSPVPGSHYEVVGDPLTERRFYLASKGSGLYRSDDGGRNWRRICRGDANAVACDPVRPDRIATALLKEGKVLLSNDAGDSWIELDASLPNRKGLKLCFSGERLVVGTDGNGVFFIDLSAKSRTGEQ